MNIINISGSPKNSWSRNDCVHTYGDHEYTVYIYVPVIWAPYSILSRSRLYIVVKILVTHISCKKKTLKKCYFNKTVDDFLKHIYRYHKN